MLTLRRNEADSQTRADNARARLFLKRNLLCNFAQPFIFRCDIAPDHKSIEQFATTDFKTDYDTGPLNSTTKQFLIEYSRQK